MKAEKAWNGLYVVVAAPGAAATAAAAAADDDDDYDNYSSDNIVAQVKRRK
jgi:hypothetical protein